MHVVGLGSCHGTFGELAQGVWNGRPFLITFPIVNRSRSMFIPDQNIEEVEGSLQKSKAILACQKLLNYYGIKSGGKLTVQSQIPTGKGMASSTADIISALKAVAHVYSLPLSEELMSQLAIEVEPSDGVMYSEVCSYDYLHGALIETLGKLPPMRLIGIDFGGEVDTISYNQMKRTYSQQEKALLQKAYESIKLGMIEEDNCLIWKGSTLSADINQSYLPKPYYKKLKALAISINGGIITSHSGTVLGILIDHKCPIQEINKLCTQISRITEREPFKVEIL